MAAFTSKGQSELWAAGDLCLEIDRQDVVVHGQQLLLADAVWKQKSVVPKTAAEKVQRLLAISLHQTAPPSKPS